MLGRLVGDGYLRRAGEPCRWCINGQVLRGEDRCFQCGRGLEAGRFATAEERRKGGGRVGHFTSVEGRVQ